MSECIVSDTASAPNPHRLELSAARAASLIDGATERAARGGRTAAHGAPARLSRLPIWSLQQSYYEDAGIEAWRHNIVPSYVTTNPYIAGTYARVARAFIDDCRRSGTIRAGQPVHVVELGAGSGRFAHHFLSQFHGDVSELPDDEPPVRYVMTDASRANIDFWQAHESFAPLLRTGRLDVARFDVARDDEIVLEMAGTRIAPGSSAPLIVIANYVFDSVALDAFRVDDGRLLECQATMRPNDPDRPPAERIEELGIDFHARPCSTDYYDDPSWNALLAHYAQNLRRGNFFLPVDALACLARLRAMTSGPLLILSCDRGQTQLDAFEDTGLPQPLSLGSFSFPVNYHALLEWTRQTGGLAFESGHDHASIAVVALAFGVPAAKRRALAQIYDTEVRRFGPDDFFMLKKATEETHDRLTLPQLLALLRLSQWDPAILHICYQRLVAMLPEASPAQRRDLRAGLAIMWRQYFYLGEEQDLAFAIGSLLAGMGYARDAAGFFTVSIARHGANPATVRNLARCEAACRRAPA